MFNFNELQGHVVLFNPVHVNKFDSKYKKIVESNYVFESFCVGTKKFTLEQLLLPVITSYYQKFLPVPNSICK